MLRRWPVGTSRPLGLVLPLLLLVGPMASEIMASMDEMEEREDELVRVFLRAGAEGFGV
jgi:hypothetical protein